MVRKRIINNWVHNNIFYIHEYAEGGSHETWMFLCDSLKEALKGARTSIHKQVTTKFGDVVRIIYRPHSFTLEIHKTPEKYRTK